MKGRKPKPDHLVQMLGNPGKRARNINQPNTASDLPRGPAWLNERAAELFDDLVDRLAAQKLASSSHTELLALAAMRLDEVERCSAVIDRDGASYQTTNSQGDRAWKSRPEVAMRSEAARHAHALLVEFGLSPSAMNRVSPCSAPEEHDAFAELFFGSS